MIHRLASSVLLGLAVLPAGTVSGATQNEVCESSSFAISGPQRKRCGKSTQNQIFWVPSLQPGCPAPSGPAVVATPNGNLTLYTPTPRLLEGHGKPGANILIGSPGSSDILYGVGGKDTYVVGGNANYIIGVGDMVFSVPTSAEGDVLTLGTDIDFVHIDSSLQLTPRSISLAAGGSQMVRSGGEVAGTYPKLGCVSFRASPYRWQASVMPSLASLPVPAHSDVPPQLLAQPPFTRAPANYPARIGLVPTTDGAVFSGAPTIVGLDVRSGAPDRLLLPDTLYSYNQESLQGRTAIPLATLDLPDLKTLPLAKPDQFRQLLRRSKGLRLPETDPTPLVYLRQQGLLVFFANSKPLGSAGNPGRVIARLLDDSGKPLDIPGASPGFVTTVDFVRFEPSDPR